MLRNLICLKVIFYKKQVFLDIGNIINFEKNCPPMLSNVDYDDVLTDDDSDGDEYPSFPVINFYIIY